jgi:hypothetical protein
MRQHLAAFPCLAREYTQKGEQRWEKKAARKIKTSLSSKSRSRSKRKRNNRRTNYPSRNPNNSGESLPDSRLPTRSSVNTNNYANGIAAITSLQKDMGLLFCGHLSDQFWQT